MFWISGWDRQIHIQNRRDAGFWGSLQCGSLPAKLERLGAQGKDRIAVPWAAGSTFHSPTRGERVQLLQVLLAAPMVHRDFRTGKWCILTTPSHPQMSPCRWPGCRWSITFVQGQMATGQQKDSAGLRPLPSWVWQTGEDLMSLQRYLEQSHCPDS